MKRLKIFALAVISVLIMIIISSNIFAAVQSLNSDGTLVVHSAADMYSMNNVLCVENGQILTGEFGDTTFKIKASIEIRGKKLTLKKWNEGNCSKSGCTCNQFKGGNGTPHKVETFDGYNNANESFPTQSATSTSTVGDLTTYANKLAGIFFTSGLENGGTNQYGGGNIAAQQITVWYAWNGFNNRLPSDGTGSGIWDWGGTGSIKAGSGNISGLSSSEKTAAQNNWAKIDTTKEYSINIYYLDCGTQSWQALILYDKNIPDETVDIPVKKVWNDDNNRDGKRLNSIEVELLKNGNATGNKRTLSVNNNWSAKFTNLAKQENGRDINYSVREYPSNTNVQKLKNSGYTESVSGNATNGFTITNTYVPEKTSISVEKEWKDGENRDAIRPTSIQVTLMADGSKVTKNTSGATITNPITLNEQNGWKYEFTDLYKNKNGGTEINYSVTETLPDGYSLGTTKTVDGNKISIKLTNTHVPQEVQIPVKKVWDDDTDRDGLRPSEIKLTLKADGVAIATHTLTGLNTSNEWSYTFTSTDEVTLYKYKNVNGKQVKIVYTVEEEKITNSQSYDSQLKYEDPVINPSSVTAKDGDANKTTDTITITNKHKPETTNIVVIKNWDDDDNRDDMRPQSITFRLKGPGNQNAKYADGKEVELIVLSESNDWRYEVKNLPRYYDHGKEINYTLEEVRVPAEYTYKVGEIKKNETTKAIIEITGINHHDPELIEIPITKTWDDDTDRDGLRPDSIQLELWADKGTQYEKLVQTAVITGSNNENTWSYTFKSTHQSPYEQRIFKYRHNGILINYTIVEREIRNSQPYNKDEKYENPKYTTGRNTTSTDKAGTITGSKTIRDTRTDGFGVINKHEPERTRIVVRKDWKDKTDLDEYRPDTIELVLLANGQEVRTDADGNRIGPITLRDPEGGFSDTWEYTVENLFRYYDHGKTIDYTVIERNVPDHYNEEEVNISKQEYTPETGTQIITITKPNTHEPHYDGYIEIKGKVWLDKPDGKANAINGILDDDETGIEKVKVILKDKDGKAMNATYANERGQFNSSEFGYTANDGTYTIRVNYDNSYNVYKLYEEVSKVQEKLKTAYVEFQYDGLKYTTVKQAATGANTSKAIENETSRANFDRNHSTVNSTTNPDTWSDKYVEAITKDVISFETYSDKTVDSKRTEVVKYCKGNNTYIRTNPEGAWNDVLTGKKSLSNHRDHTGNCSSGGHTMRTFEVEVEIINNVNLGLFEREQPDIAIFSELSKVELVMNNQHYTYLYSNRTTVTEEKAQQAYDEAYRDAKNRGMSDAEAAVYAKQLQMQVKFQNADTYTYRRPVNPADIAYIQEQTDPNILNVKVSYDIKIGNLSTTLPVTVNSIKNYFDNEYTLESCYTKALKCTEQHMHGYRCYERANNITAAVNANNGGQFKNANINGLSITVQPQTESAPIELTYNVSLAAIKRLLNEESTLNNAVEIDSYSTQYGANTLYAEQRTGGRTGNPYAGYDSDSRPGNVVPENRIFINSEGRIEISNIEDDEDIAPAFTLCKDEEKTMSGNVWEDSDINENDDLRLGDGKKTSGEQNLANAKVELLKPVVDAAGERLETAKLYSIEGGVVKTRDAVTYSDSNGNYTFGDDIFGVVTDRYVMKFTYGEGMPGVTEPTSINRATVNARNYKSTIISSDTVLYEIFKGTSTNEEWHLNIPAGRSIAVDTIEKRLEIDNLRYSNFDDAIYMEAYSKPFKMQVEFDSNPDKTSDVDENGENANLKNNLAVFDFGIVERARENIVVEKTIEHLNVTLANGNILTQGDPTKDTLDYVSAPGLKNRILTAEDSARYGNKSITIQVDPELIQGARLELKYAITVRNNSEKDYDYETNTDYYFFGEKTGNIIKSSVNYLVDYMDNKSAIKWDNEGIWQVVKADDLTTGGFISTETGENTTIGRLESGKYNAYVTDQFKDVAPGEAKTEYATVTRTLANSDENLCENHIEILEIDSKVARTIEGKDKNTGTPIMKSYKMGNYIPSLDNTITANEQDDDRIKITVTGPTGLTTYVITYLVVGLAGLIILVIGVVIIKKKVLTK